MALIKKVFPTPPPPVSKLIECKLFVSEGRHDIIVQRHEKSIKDLWKLEKVHGKRAKI